ncbi:hypothetical protein FZZ93_18095 [Halomonas eurihalina]|uniref:Uncharacterized protein n=1 Tax=Halomonas eurihalina TaxID=42566 RepID=A0A5D9CKL7_HALER|nr:hypothetical protein [Halomonas eurihalina]MDR5860468.1 hypothetical protein [Halomonas eurihalina]TZG30641.1 hypothetical protein FZZ93_18095 [Halomonas eurihalina]
MIDLKLSLGILILLVGAISLLSLLVWWMILLMYLEEIDGYFDSPDFPHRGVKGLWPWGMGRAVSYGVFVLFTDSHFVRKKFPKARESIDIKMLPRKVRFIVAFPIYTYIPSALFIGVVGVCLYMKDWFF